MAIRVEVLEDGTLHYISDGHIVVTGGPVDPRFSEPLSGLYWQVADDRGQVMHDRTTCDSPTHRRRVGDVAAHDIDAVFPLGGRVLVRKHKRPNRSAALQGGGHNGTTQKSVCAGDENRFGHATRSVGVMAAQRGWVAAPSSAA